MWNRKKEFRLFFQPIFTQKDYELPVKTFFSKDVELNILST